MTDLADVREADDLYETASHNCELARQTRANAKADVEACKERYDYWCGQEAQALVELERAARHAADMRKAAGLVLTASGYVPGTIA